MFFNVAASGGSGATTLDDLTDVVVPEPSNNDVLVYQDGVWVNLPAIASAIADLVDSSPETLDTLNELAAALGDDENFATTVVNALANKSDVGHVHTQYAVANEVRSDVQSGKSYMGIAPAGTSQSSSLWRITRIDVAVTPPTVTQAVNVAWTNRTTAIYS